MAGKSFLKDLVSQWQEEEDFSPEDLSEIEEGFDQIRRGKFGTINLEQEDQHMRYQLRGSHQAQKSLAGLDQNLAKRIGDHLRELVAPFFDPRLAPQMEMAPSNCHFRVDNWRIIFALDELEGALEVAAVLPCHRVYEER